MPDAEAIKAQGNEFFQAGKYTQALERYKTATDINPDVAAYWSNLAACHEKLAEQKKGNRRNQDAEEHWNAMEDAARNSIDCDPSFAKGYYRLAVSQQKMDDLEGALETCQQGLDQDSDNANLLQLQKDVAAELQRAREAYNSDSDDDDNGDETDQGKKDLFAHSWALKKRAALEWESVYERALEGDPEAQYEIGTHYRNHHYGIISTTTTTPNSDNSRKKKKKNADEEAMKWLEKAANNGHPGAQYFFAQHYQKLSDEGNEDPDTCLKWYKRAFETSKRQSKDKKREQTAAIGLYWLSICHREGNCHDLIERDQQDLGAHTGIDKRSIKQQRHKHCVLALEYMEEAAKKSYPPAQYALGVGYMYAANKKGPFFTAIPKADPKTALDWLDASCFWYGQLDSSTLTVAAQYELGKWHAHGQGLLGRQADPFHAAVWLSRSAIRGHVGAKAEMKNLVSRLSNDSTADAPKKSLLARISQRDTKEVQQERHDKALLYLHKHYLISDKVLERHEAKMMRRDNRIIIREEREERRQELKEQRANGSRRGSWFGGMSSRRSMNDETSYYSDEESYSSSGSDSGSSYSSGSDSGSSDSGSSYSGSSYSSRDESTRRRSAPPPSWQRASAGSGGRSQTSRQRRPREYSHSGKKGFPDDMSEISDSNRDFSESHRSSSRRGRYYD